MTSNFFDCITLADKETVQSAVIAWVFSDKCNGLTFDSRLNALGELFGVPSSELNGIDSIVAKTEWQHIDILFELRKGDDVQAILVIENKIKSGLHDNQLERYVEQLSSKCILKSTNVPNPYHNVKYYLAYLTLLKRGDIKVPDKSDNNVTWKNVCYNDLYDKLNKSLEGSSTAPAGQHIDHQIAKSYCESINQMAAISKDAMDNPSLIFEKNILNPDVEQNHLYIQEHKLGHVLQVYYFEKIKESISGDIRKEFSDKEVKISDIRVNYGLQSDDAEFLIEIKAVNIPGFNKYLDSISLENDGEALFWITFQKNSFVIAIGKDYHNKDKHKTNCEWLEDRKLLRIGKCSEKNETIWDKYKKHGNTKWRCNAPKKGYPRMSISIDANKILPLNNQQHWYDKPNESLKQGFKICIDTLLDIFRTNKVLSV